MRRLSFSATAWLNFWQNWWNILKHSSILNVFVSSQKNSASDRLTASSSSISLFNCAISRSAICKFQARVLFDFLLSFLKSFYLIYIYIRLVVIFVTWRNCAICSCISLSVEESWIWFLIFLIFVSKLLNSLVNCSIVVLVEKNIYCENNISFVIVIYKYYFLNINLTLSLLRGQLYPLKSLINPSVFSQLAKILSF